jgi:hypothetical protein
MTLEVLCGGCGKVLYSGYDLRSPKEVVRASGGKCTGCGKPIIPSDFTLEVLKAEETV